MPSRTTSRRDGVTILIVAVSGRALASAARRVGEKVIVADLFADRDTAEMGPCVRVPGVPAGGLDYDALLSAVEKFRNQIGGIVYGSGFERDPSVLRRLAEIAPILGNPAEVVERIKDPFGFSATLARLGLPHPATTALAPRLDGWLRKLAGGAGGGHILPTQHAAPSPRAYYQKKVGGRAVSALFVANGRAARVLGFSTQWCSPSPAAPYRYGGSAAPLPLPDTLAARLAAACNAIAAETRLVGLNSLDTLVSGLDFTILEVNPRPGATLDVFDGAGDASLWRIHHAALNGQLPPLLPAAMRPRAAMIVYAPSCVRVPTGVDWPAWTADRPPDGTVIGAEEPICTVLATANSVGAAIDCVRRRTRQILHVLSTDTAERRSS